MDKKEIKKVLPTMAVILAFFVVVLISLFVIMFLIESDCDEHRSRSCVKEFFTGTKYSEEYYCEFYIKTYNREIYAYEKGVWLEDTRRINAKSIKEATEKMMKIQAPSLFGAAICIPTSVSVTEVTR